MLQNYQVYEYRRTKTPSWTVRLKTRRLRCEASFPVSGWLSEPTGATRRSAFARVLFVIYYQTRMLTWCNRILSVPILQAGSAFVRKAFGTPTAMRTLDFDVFCLGGLRKGSVRSWACLLRASGRVGQQSGLLANGPPGCW